MVVDSVSVFALLLPYLFEHGLATDIVAIFPFGFLQLLIDDGWPVQGVQVEGGWLEVDTVSDLELYERLAESGELDAYCELERVN